MAIVKTQLVIDGKNNTKKAIGEVDNDLGRLSGTAKAAGAAILGAFSVGVVAGFVKQSALAVIQMERMAKLSGATSEQFQKWAYASRTVGIEQDKLGDIFKDVQDKVGDFLQTGGGPLADFFENIAPAAGVTAEQFRNLSGPDALQLYVKTLESANLSQAEMTFYMEAIANDASLLLPLLRNNGAAYAELAEQAKELGLILSSDTVQQASQFNQSMNALGAISQGAGQQIAAELLPSLNELSGLMVDVSKEGAYTSRVAEVLGFAMKVLASTVLIAGNGFGNLGRRIAGAAAAAVATAKGDFAQAAEILRMVGEDNERETKLVMERVSKLWTDGYTDVGRQVSSVNTALSASTQEAGARVVKTTEEMKEAYKSLSADARKAISSITAEERKAASEVEKVRKERLAIEERYSAALAQLRGGGVGEASYGAAQALKVGARQSLNAGDLEGAKRQAQQALEMLLDLQAAGENTYGLTGFAKELQAIEMQANSLEQTAADQKLAQITAELDRVQKLSDVKITVGMTPEAIEAAKQQLQKLAEYLGKEMVITPTVAVPEVGVAANAAPADTYTGAQGFATGGLIRGPGTGTSDSILMYGSNGEYMINAAAVRKLGVPFLNMINQGIVPPSIPRFAEGGLIGQVASMEPHMPRLGVIDFKLGGDTYQLYAPANQVDPLRAAARKFGRTHR
ncbi:MAG: hypothetical protein KJ890_07750 [Gammaproteobacteria bacterium]|nr:hypothetical protein [Gammaproteobacteria bacterium]MBU0789896.1 hypothetical protein [Gammaproteobacteria bacterium]MBU1805304.1 hypothetical protein [Gammaproteobacteria bacterium]